MVPACLNVKSAIISNDLFGGDIKVVGGEGTQTGGSPDRENPGGSMIRGIKTRPMELL